MTVFCVRCSVDPHEHYFTDIRDALVSIELMEMLCDGTHIMQTLVTPSLDDQPLPIKEQTND